MSNKKIQIGSKPTASKPASVSADTWVESRSTPAEAAPIVPSKKMKRLTIDITESMHRDIKRQCADQGAMIADVARELLSEWVQKNRKS